MTYDQHSVKQRYDEIAELEDASEKGLSFRVLIPRRFIAKFIKAHDRVLDAAGGTGMNAIFMAQLCKEVILVDLSPHILQVAKKNIDRHELTDKIILREGDITDLSIFQDEEFSFVICVGAALSYVLDKREKAIQELIRVAQQGAILIVQVQSKYGMIHNRIRKGLAEQALAIHQNKVFYDGLGVKSHLYTVQEITDLLRKKGCEILEIASTPVFTHTANRDMYKKNQEKLGLLEQIEYQYCTKPELLGLGHHILVVAQKSSGKVKRSTNTFKKKVI